MPDSGGRRFVDFRRDRRPAAGRPRVEGRVRAVSTSLRRHQSGILRVANHAFENNDRRRFVRTTTATLRSNNPDRPRKRVGRVNNAKRQRFSRGHRNRDHHRTTRSVDANASGDDVRRRQFPPGKSKPFVVSTGGLGAKEVPGNSGPLIQGNAEHQYQRVPTTADSPVSKSAR